RRRWPVRSSRTRGGRREPNWRRCSRTCGSRSSGSCSRRRRFASRKKTCACSRSAIVSARPRSWTRSPRRSTSCKRKWTGSRRAMITRSRGPSWRRWSGGSCERTCGGAHHLGYRHPDRGFAEGLCAWGGGGACVEGGGSGGGAQRVRGGDGAVGLGQEHAHEPDRVPGHADGGGVLAERG